MTNLHSNKTGETSDPEGADRPQLLPRRNVALCELLESGVAAEASCRIRSLSCRGGYESLEESPYSSFSKYHGRSMKEALHTWFGRFSVINPIHTNDR